MRNKKNSAAVLKRLSVLLLAVMLVVGMLSTGSVGALSANQVSRLNVMLVIDGSGSLTMTGGTDTQGYRYEAIDLFLALLTNDGNNAGAIVFNHDILLNTPIAPISGKADKLALSQQIRDAGAYGDTNIGGALMSAVDACEAATAANGMKSVILLFSDGRTDVPGAQEESLEAKEQATTRAQSAGIPIHSICLNASSVADPAELQEISDRTSGSFTSVSQARDLTAAFENFYKLIFPGSSNEITQSTFGADGKLSFEIQIPTYGAEEVNIILDNENLKGKAITAPGGAMSDGDIDNTTMTGGIYDVVKLVAPEKGLWQVDLTGVPGTNVTVNVLYNIDSAAQLQTAEGKTDYGVGETINFQVQLLQQGSVVTDSVVTQEYTAKLILTNLTTGEVEQTLDMTPSTNGMFVCSFTSSEYCSYNAKAELYYSNLTLGSNDLPINFGNTAPVANPTLHEVKATVTPISGKSKNVDITGFFSDGQDTQLTYTMVSSQLIQGTVYLNPQGVLEVNTAKSRSGDVVIQAMDSQGAVAQMTVRFKVTNLTWVIFGTIIAGVLVGLGILAGALYAVMNQPFNGMITVTATNGGIERTHSSFRGKLTLERLGIRGSGFVKGYFIAKRHNQVEFRASNDIFVPNAFQTDTKKIPLYPGYNEIYSDDTHTVGIEVNFEPRA